MRSKLHSHKPITPINTTHPLSYTDPSILEQKRRELATISTLKLNIKKVIISLQNKKKSYTSLETEYSLLKSQTSSLLNEKLSLQRTKSTLDKRNRSAKSTTLKGANYITTITQMIKQDKLDGHTEQRERYDSLRSQNIKLTQCYVELTQHLRELRTKYNDIQEDNTTMISKLNNEILKHK